MLFFKSRRYVILFIEWMKEIHPKSFEEKFKTTSILSNLISNQITLNTAEQMNHGPKIHLARHLPLSSSICIFSSFPGPANNCDAACGGWPGLRWRLEILNFDKDTFEKLLQFSFREHCQYSDNR